MPTFQSAGLAIIAGSAFLQDIFERRILQRLVGDEASMMDLLHHSVAVQTAMTLARLFDTDKNDLDSFGTAFRLSARADVRAFVFARSSIEGWKSAQVTWRNAIKDPRITRLRAARDYTLAHSISSAWPIFEKEGWLTPTDIVELGDVALKIIEPLLVSYSGATGFANSKNSSKIASGRFFERLLR